MAGKPGEKILEKAMDAKKADQTKNVKKLTTSNDAYSPEKRIIHGRRNNRSGSTNFVKITTDQVDLNAEKKKLKKENPSFNVGVYTPKEYRKFRGKPEFDGEQRKKSKSKVQKRSLKSLPRDEQLQNLPRVKRAGGGMSQRGLGRAFMKGGKV